MNPSDPRSFAERLMNSESSDEALRRRYEEAKQALLERRLTRSQRWLGWLGLPVNGLLVVGLLYQFLTTKPSLPREWIMMEAVCAVGLLALGLWNFRVLLRAGRVTWGDDRAMQWIGGLGLCALTFALFEVALSLDNARDALRLYGCVTVLLVVGTFSLLLEQMRRSKLEMQARLLELELRLAELSQMLTHVSPGVPDRRP